MCEDVRTYKVLNLKRNTTYGSSWCMQPTCCCQRLYTPYLNVA